MRGVNYVIGFLSIASMGNLIPELIVTTYFRQIQHVAADVSR